MKRDEYLTVPETAEKLGVRAAEIYRLIDVGDLEAIQADNQVLVVAASLPASHHSSSGAFGK